MATLSDAKSDVKLKKRSGPKHHIQRIMGKVTEGVPPETPPKELHPQISKGQPAQHSLSAQAKPPSQLARQEIPKDDPDIDRLQRDYQVIRQGTGVDMKIEGPDSLPLAAHDPRLEDPKLMRQVTDIAHVPKPTNAIGEPGSSLPDSTPTIYSVPPMSRITPVTMVDEPDRMVTGVAERPPRRPSMSHQTQSRIHQVPVLPDVQQQRGPLRQSIPVTNGQHSESHEALQSKLQMAQYEIQSLQRKLDDRARVADERSVALESMRISQNNMISELNGARDDCEQHRVNASQLEGEIAEIRVDLLERQSRFDIVNNELLQLRANLDKHVSDKWFQAQWKDLHARIEGVSNQYFLGRQSRFQGSILSRGKGARPDKLDIHPSISLTRLTSEHARYLGSEHERPIIIQAFIWWVLVNRIFAHMACDEWGFFWAGQSRELLYHLKRQIMPQRPRDWSHSDPGTIQRLETDARNYHNWRATTTILLLTRTSVDKRIKNLRDLIGELVGDVLHQVSPYIVVSKGTSPAAAEDGFCKQLETIFTEAIKVDAQMAQQRAWVYCEQWRAHMEGDPLWGFACDQDEADIIQTADQSKARRAQGQGSCVELIVQPALLRDGNQYGEEYSRQQVLCKAKVVLGETSLPLFKHR